MFVRPRIAIVLIIAVVSVLALSTACTRPQPKSGLEAMIRKLERQPSDLADEGAYRLVAIEDKYGVRYRILRVGDVVRSLGYRYGGAPRLRIGAGGEINGRPVRIELIRKPPKVTFGSLSGLGGLGGFGATVGLFGRPRPRPRPRPVKKRESRPKTNGALSAARARQRLAQAPATVAWVRIDHRFAASKRIVAAIAALPAPAVVLEVVGRPLSGLAWAQARPVPAAPWMARLAPLAKKLVALYVQPVRSGPRHRFTAADLRRLAALPRLRALGLEGDFAPGALVALGGLTQLGRLEIDPGARASPLIGMLSRKGRPRPAPRSRRLPAGVLSKLVQLEVLRLRHVDLAAAAGEIAALSRLRELRVGGSFRDELPPAFYEGLVRLGGLEVLELDNQSLGRTQVAALGRLTRLVRLRFAADSSEILAPLGKLQALRSLSLARAALYGGAPQLTWLRRLRRLQILDLSGTRLPGTVLASVAQLPALRSLDLSRTAPKDGDLAPLRGATSLRRLLLRETRLRGPGLRHLRALPALRELDISETPAACHPEATALRRRPKLRVHGECSPPDEPPRKKVRRRRTGDARRPAPRRPPPRKVLPSPPYLLATVGRPARWLVRGDAYEGRKIELQPLATSRILAVAGQLRDIIPRALSADSYTAVIAAFAIRFGRRVVGPLRLPPKTHWVGVGRGERIYAATVSGALYVATSIARARTAGGFRRLIQLPGKARWDAAGPVVIGARGTSVWVSRTDGSPFVRHKFTTPVKQVFARSDGIALAVERGRWPWITRDGGRTWVEPPAAVDPTKAPAPRGKMCNQLSMPRGRMGFGYSACWFPTPPTFARSGDWIGAHPRWLSTCQQGVLARDGRTWLAPRRLPRGGPYGWAAWGRPAVWSGRTPFAVSMKVASYRRPGWPAAPRRGKSARRETERCAAKPAAFFNRAPRRGGGGGGIGFGGYGRRGRGVRFGVGILGRPAGVDFPLLHGLLSDAVCPGGNCTRALTRAPTMLTLHPKTRRAIAATAAPCAPAEFGSYYGIGILVCRPRAGRSAVYLGDGRGRWTPQGTIPAGEISAVDVAPDGTILLESCTSKSCRAYVRAPMIPAVRGSLRAVSYPHAAGYRAMTGGRALAVARRRAGDDTGLVLALLRSGARAQRLATVDRVPAVLDVTIKRRRLHVSTTRGDFYLRRDGRLERLPK